MNPAAILTRREQPRLSGGGIQPKFNPAHHVMRGGSDLDPAARQIETAIPAPLDHSGKGLFNLFRAKMAHGDIDPAHGGGAAFAHLVKDTAADNITGGALTGWVIGCHEAVPAPLSR